MNQYLKKVLLLFCGMACVLSLVVPAAAANTIDSGQTGSIAVEIRDPDSGKLYAEQAEMRLYQIAVLEEKDGAQRFVPAADFSAVTMDFDNFTASHELEIIQAVQRRIAALSLRPQGTAQGSTGKFAFADLPPGIYMLTYHSSGQKLTIAPFLVSMPARGTGSGGPVYHQTVYPKYEIKKPESPTNPSTPVRPTYPNPDPNPSRPSRPTPNRPGTSDRDRPGTSVTPPSLTQISTPDVPLTTTTPGGKLPQTGVLRWPILLLGALGIVFFMAGWIDVFLKKEDPHAQKS